MPWERGLEGGNGRSDDGVRLCPHAVRFIVGDEEEIEVMLTCGQKFLAQSCDFLFVLLGSDWLVEDVIFLAVERCAAKAVLAVPQVGGESTVAGLVREDHMIAVVIHGGLNTVRTPFTLEADGEINAAFVPIRLDAVGAIFIVETVETLVAILALCQMITDTFLCHELMEREVRCLFPKFVHPFLDEFAMRKILQIKFSHPLFIFLLR